MKSMSSAPVATSTALFSRCWLYGPVSWHAQDGFALSLLGKQGQGESTWLIQGLSCLPSHLPLVSWALGNLVCTAHQHSQEVHCNTQGLFTWVFTSSLGVRFWWWFWGKASTVLGSLQLSSSPAPRLSTFCLHNSMRLTYTLLICLPLRTPFLDPNPMPHIHSWPIPWMKSGYRRLVHFPRCHFFRSWHSFNRSFNLIF